jgi:hypothetical protein
MIGAMEGGLPLPTIMTCTPVRNDCVSFVGIDMLRRLDVGGGRPKNMKINNFLLSSSNSSTNYENKPDDHEREGRMLVVVIW